MLASVGKNRASNGFSPALGVGKGKIMSWFGNASAQPARNAPNPVAEVITQIGITSEIGAFDRGLQLRASVRVRIVRDLSSLLQIPPILDP